MQNLQNTEAPRFASLRDAARITGLSEGFLRAGCKAHSLPHIMAGKKYMIDLHALSRRLDELSGAGSVNDSTIQFVK